MKKGIAIDETYVKRFLKQDVLSYQKRVDELHQSIHQKNGAGNDFLGWLEVDQLNTKEDIKRIQSAANQIKSDSDVLVVIGIGGSYLGAKAGLTFLNPNFKKKPVEVIFAGHHMASDYLSELLAYLENKHFSINVISKSGTTTEPAIAFRFLRKLLINKYGLIEANKRIYATTDQKRGALYSQAVKQQYTRFVIPDDVGGRFSVLTAVGLLIFAVQDIDIEQMLLGAGDAYQRFSNAHILDNEAYHYAVLRYQLYQEGKKIELLGSYDPALSDIGEWWKQLFGESEGKNHLGLFPSNLNLTTDLHSLGQYIQDGERHLFETIIQVESSNQTLILFKEEDDGDELNYLEGKSLDDINVSALKGTMIAHHQGDVPNILLTLPKKDAYHLGYLFYFFEKACAMSAYLLGVNPYNQPGVVDYKNSMFKLLGKKGY